MSLPLNSLKFKISVLSMLILAVILAVYSGFLFLTFRMTLYQEMDAALVAKGQKISNAVAAYLEVLGSDHRSFEFSVRRVVSQKGEHPHKNKIERLERLWIGQAEPLGIRRDYVEFLDPSGRRIVRSPNFPPGTAIPVSGRAGQAVQKGRTVFSDIELSGERLRVMILPAVYPRVGKGGACMILVATSRERVAGLLREHFMIQMVLVGFILIVASLLSQVFVQRILLPVLQITETARNINYKDLSRRIKTDDVDREMKDLVDALNEMMSRLERSFRYIAEFSSHVSHELKTPLAVMRGESELALRADHSPEEYRRVLRANLVEITAMSKIIEDLLLLTKLEYQPHVFHLEPLDMKEFAAEMEEPIRLLADEKDIRVAFDLPDESVPIRGDKAHLRRLFFNLVSNAIKFTPAGGNIRIRMRVQNDRVMTEFSDDGIGIPEENLPRIFEKFFHSGGAAQGVSGNGLGLSIAQSIAKVHAGSISVVSRFGEGSTFTVSLPLGASAPRPAAYSFSLAR